MKTTTSKSLRYKVLIQQNPKYRKLYWAEVISVAGSWFNTIALLGYVYTATNSPFMVSLTLITSSLPAVILSPFVGVLVDRTDRKKLMVLIQIIRGVLALGYLLAPVNLWAVFVVNILLSFAGIFFAPSKQAILPLTVNREQISVANALSSSTSGIMSVLGASLGGIASDWIKPEYAFIINSLSFFLAAGFISRIEMPPIQKAALKKKFFQDMKTGFEFILKTPIIFSLVFAGISWGFVGGAYQVLLTVFGSNVFHAAKSGIGILYAVQGIGVIIGGSIVTRFVSDHQERMKFYFGWAYLLQGIFFLLFVWCPNIYFGVPALLMMRISGGIIIPLDSTLIQNNTPRELLGKVFSLHSTAYSSVMQFSMFLTGMLLVSISPRWVGTIFGGLCLIISVAWLILAYGNKLKNVTISEWESQNLM